MGVEQSLRAGGNPEGYAPPSTSETAAAYPSVIGSAAGLDGPLWQQPPAGGPAPLPFFSFASQAEGGGLPPAGGPPAGAGMLWGAGQDQAGAGSLSAVKKPRLSSDDAPPSQVRIWH